MWVNEQQEFKLRILDQVTAITGLPAFVVEKDWWVCIVLKAVFQSQYANSIIFKGGTSLSKAYQIIERFSEDIDLIIDRHLLGFDELDTKSKIKKLRKASGGFVINEFRNELITQLQSLGIPGEFYEIKYNEHVDDTSDPNTLEIYYHSVTPVNNAYIQKRVLLELGARSLTEPSERRPVVSFLDEQFNNLSFAMPAFDVQVVVPSRTFIEKMLLLHEEFSKPIGKIRTDRLTRHLYDLEKLMDTIYGAAAFADNELFEKIVQHRKTITHLRGMSYDNHAKGRLQIIPPRGIFSIWRDDYETMRENMIVGESLVWEKLIERIEEIQSRFNSIPGN